MIWTDVGTHPKIEKASLSGNQRVAVVTTYLYLPNGIELDKGSKRIFWVDAIYDRVETVDYSGNTRKILFQLDGLHPFGVVLVAPFLFFTDWNTYREAHKLDATTGQLLRSYSINGGRPMGIVAYDSARQPSGIYRLTSLNNFRIFVDEFCLRLEISTLSKRPSLSKVLVTLDMLATYAT